VKAVTAGYYVLLLLLIFMCSLTIPVRPTTSKSTGLTFTKFSGKATDDQSETGRCHGNQILLFLCPEVIFESRQWPVAQPGGLTLGFALHLVCK